MRLTGTPNWLTIKKGKSPESGDDRSPPKGPGAGQVWAVGGGKGGIGKSFLVANLGAVAATLGRRVILIDVDLGAANLHTCLGVRGGSRVNLSDYLEDRVADLEKAAIQTPIPGLRLILGALGHVGARETTRAQRSELLRAVRALPADLVILDLAAGTERATLDFFLVSDCSFVVTTPEPTAIENAYGFLRASYYRRLGHALSSSSVRDLLRVAMDQRNERGIRTPADLLEEIERLDPREGQGFRRVLEEFRPRLILNQVRSPEEVKMGFSIRSVCRKHFGIDVEYVGYVNFDNAAWRSVKERRPLVLAYPQSDGSLYIRRILKKILET
jgi:flagellar biosynthesis protein FlhG